MISFKTNDAELSNTIKKLHQKISNPISLMKALGVQIQGSMEKNFNNMQDSTGKNWRPLAETTIKSRLKRTNPRKNNKYGAKPLSDTGALRKLTFNAERNSVTIGTTVNYGHIHNEGTKYIPKREWAYINKDGKEKVRILIENYLKI